MRLFGRTIRVAALALAVLTGATTAGAQDAPTTLDADARSATVTAAAEALRSRYVFPDVGEAAAAAIEAALAAGDYDALSEPHAFAERLTTDLQAVTNDKHMRVSAQGPAPTPAAGAAPRMSPPSSQGGVTRADRLADNIGYIEVVGFPPLGVFTQGADPAMAALAETRALIVDVRRNGGGSPVSVSHLVSYFVPAGEPVHINTFFNRNPGTEEFEIREFWSSPTPFSYAGKPVYVLTSNRTFSGGEEFAYDMQAMDLGVLVGETTGGGANPGGMAQLTPGLGLFVPGGRAENPITKANWEGVGVIPDIATPVDDALKAALEQLGVSATETGIDALSAERLFTPRTTAQPGSEEAVRRLLDEMARGEPDYTMMTEDMAELTRNQLAGLQQMFSGLGAIASVSFHSVDQGADVYNVVGANRSVSFQIVLTDDGKVALAGMGPPRPAQ